MFIILKNDLLKKEKSVANIIYGDKYESYVNNLLQDSLEFYENDDNVTYSIDKETNSINKAEKIVEKGYLYNNTTTKESPVLTYEVLEYNPKHLEYNKTSSDGRLWENLNREINHRVLRNMDKDSLYQVFVALDKNMKLKTNWTNLDYINILNELLKNFRKELYSSIAKKLKRYRASAI
jgi:hypothetical protein